MHVITYLPNLHLHILLLVVFQKTPHTAQWKVTLLTFICCLFTPSRWAFFFFSIHKAHTFARPDTFCKVRKRLGNAVQMVKILFLSVRLRDVNVLITWSTKFRLKVSCLFSCAVEGGWFVRSYKMKHFTRQLRDWLFCVTVVTVVCSGEICCVLRC